MSFEWQTEEEYDWDEPSAPPESSPPRRRRWPWILLIVLLLGGTAVFLLSRQLNQRVEQATDNIEADLIASYTVLQQAAVSQDENLFKSLLSGREPDWATAQKENIISERLFDRPSFGLAWQPGLAETAVISTTFSPELNAAELITVQNYTLDIGNGLTQTVQLQRPDVFRLGQDRWLLAPPEHEFWGVRRRLEGQLVSVRYPARDAEIVHRLAADLEAKLVQFCATPGIGCPAETQVRLIFSTEPESLTEATFTGAFLREDQGNILAGGQAVRLPTPSLVGLPQDEVGYQAIFRGYAAQMLTLVINDLTGWECCQNGPFYRAAVERQLYELGVGTWPLATEFFSQTAVSLPNDLILLADGHVQWNAPFPETPTQLALAPAPYAFVDFLATDLHLPPAQIITSLAENEQALFTDWLLALTGSPWTEATLGHAFREYVAAWQDEPAELPQPKADLLLLCQNHNRNDLAIYRYDFSEREPLLLEVLDYSEAFFTGFPDGSGLAVVGRQANSQPETFLLRNGEQRIEVNWNDVEGVTSRPPLAIPTIMDPNGRYLLWTVTPGFATGTFYALTDLDACHDGNGCEIIPIGGYPIWSPNSEQLLTLTVTNPWWRERFNSGLMFLRPSPTANAINSPGFGASPFWLNNEQFGFIARFQNGNQQILLSDDDLNPPRVVIDNESLRTSLTVAMRPDNLLIHSAHPLPTNPRILTIVAADLDQGEIPGFLFWFDLATEQITMSLPFPPVGALDAPGLRISPDGRFMLISATKTDKSSTLLLLQDSNNTTFFSVQLLGETPYPRHLYASWSPDGEWFAMPELGYVRLWHDGRNERLLTFDNLSCTNAAWVDKIQP